MTCVKNYEMCGFLKRNFKILNNNFTFVILYIKNHIVWKNDEMCGFWKLITKYWIRTEL